MSNIHHSNTKMRLATSSDIYVADEAGKLRREFRRYLSPADTDRIMRGEALDTDVDKKTAKKLMALMPRLKRHLERVTP